MSQGESDRLRQKKPGWTDDSFRHETTDRKPRRHCAGRIRCADPARPHRRGHGALPASAWSDVKSGDSSYRGRDLVLSFGTRRDVAPAEWAAGNHRAGRIRCLSDDSVGPLAFSFALLAPSLWLQWE